MNKTEIKKYIKGMCVASQRAAIAARSLSNIQRVMIIKKVIKNLKNNNNIYRGTSPGGGGYASSNLTGAALQKIGNDSEFLKEIKRVSKKFGIREGDLLGLMASESGLNPAISTLIVFSEQMS